MKPQSASLIAQAIACLEKASRIEDENDIGDALDEIIEQLDELTDGDDENDVLDDED